MIVVLSIDRRSYGAWIGETRLPVTPKEFELLAALAGGGGRLCRHADLIEALWDNAPAHGDRSLQVHVATLRKKLTGVARIVNERGAGYRLVLHDGVALTER